MTLTRDGVDVASVNFAGQATVSESFFLLEIMLRFILILILILIRYVE